MDERTESEREALDERSKRLFAESVDGIDSATLARLRAARARALRELRPWAWIKAPSAWMPAAAAAALVIVVAPQLVERAAEPPARDFGTVAASDLEILLGEQELEMLAEFEFYEWLEVENLVAPDTEVEDGVG